MGGIFKKGLAGLAVLQDPRLAFDAEHFVGNLKVVVSDHQAHQGFRDMGIEIVEDEDVPVGRMECDPVRNMLGKIGFGPRGLNEPGFDFAGDHIARSNEARGPVAMVLKFLPFDVARAHGQGRVDDLPSGNSWNEPERPGGGRCGVQVADVLHVLLKFFD